MHTFTQTHLHGYVHTHAYPLALRTFMHTNMHTEEFMQTKYALLDNSDDDSNFGALNQWRQLHMNLYGMVHHNLWIYNFVYIVLRCYERRFPVSETDRFPLEQSGQAQQHQKIVGSTYVNVVFQYAPKILQHFMSAVDVANGSWFVGWPTISPSINYQCGFSAVCKVIEEEMSSCLLNSSPTFLDTDIVKNFLNQSCLRYNILPYCEWCWKHFTIWAEFSCILWGNLQPTIRIKQAWFICLCRCVCHQDWTSAFGLLCFQYLNCHWSFSAHE